MSHIKEHNYDTASKKLKIKFSSGYEYEYSGVSEDKYKAMLRAKSKGSYFASSIRNNHKFIKTGGAATISKTSKNTIAKLNSINKVGSFL